MEQITLKGKLSFLMKNTLRKFKSKNMSKMTKKVNHFAKVQSKHLCFKLTYMHSNHSKRNSNSETFRTTNTLSQDRYAHLPTILNRHLLKKLRMNCLTQSMKRIKKMPMIVIHKMLSRSTMVRFWRRITTIVAHHLSSLIKDNLLLKINL